MKTIFSRLLLTISILVLILSVGVPVSAAHSINKPYRQVSTDPQPEPTPAHGPSSQASIQKVHLPVIMTESSNQVEVGSNTLVLSDMAEDQIQSISENGAIITFSSVTPELEQIDEGEVIIGGISEAAPDGFLRKVISVQEQSGKLVLTTEQATLEDAFESADVDFSARLTPENLQSLTNIPGVRLVSSPSMSDAFDFHVQFQDVALYDQDGNPSTTSDQIVVNGLLHFSSTFNFRLKMNLFSITEFYFTETKTVSTELTVTSKITASISPIDHIPLAPPIPLGAFAVPGTPIVLTPSLQLVAGLDGSVYTGLTWQSKKMSTTLTAGVHYVNNDFNLIGDYSTDYTVEPPTVSGGAAVKVFVGPKLSTKIYGVAGPYVKANMALKLEAAVLPNPNIMIKAGLEVPVGVNVEVFSKVWLDYQAIAISYWWTIYSWSEQNHPPHMPFSPVPLDGASDQAINVDLSWSGGDPDGDAVTYDVYFEAGDSSPDILYCNDVSSTFCNLSTLIYNTHYYWQVIARDEHGATTPGPVWDFSTGSTPNNPPYTPSNPYPPDGSTEDTIYFESVDWDGGDPDGDSVTYDVYFEANDSTPDFLLCNDTPYEYCEVANANYGTHYYWQVIARDEHGSTTAGPIWDFFITDYNRPPEIPANPSPEDGANNQDVNVDLGWYGGDLDGDSVTYDVYFESNDSSPDVLVCSNITAWNCDPGTLNYDTHYYWQVIASDEHGATTTGDVWEFTTKSQTCTPQLISPVEGATMDNGSTDGVTDPIIWDFDWSDCTGATRYHLYVKHTGSIYPVIDDSSIYQSSYRYVSYGYVADHNLDGWTWKVRAEIGGQWSNWSVIRSFKVEPPNADLN